MSELEKIVVRYEATSRADRPASFASVVSASGSTYRRIGAHMLVTEDATRWNSSKDDHSRYETESLAREPVMGPS